MKKIIAEGTEFIYLTKNEPHPLEHEIVADLTIRYYSMNNSYEEIPVDYSDTRIIIAVNPLNKQERLLYYLHWDNNQNLDDLDRQVKNNDFKTCDFQNSIKNFYQNTVCSECNFSYHSLVVPNGDFYPGAFKLLDEKIERRHFKLCPHCSSSFRQLVVKIFE